MYLFAPLCAVLTPGARARGPWAAVAMLRPLVSLSCGFGRSWGMARSRLCTPHSHSGLALALTKLDLVLAYF